MRIGAGIAVAVLVAGTASGSFRPAAKNGAKPATRAELLERQAAEFAARYRVHIVGAAESRPVVLPDLPAQPGDDREGVVEGQFRWRVAQSVTAARPDKLRVSIRLAMLRADGSTGGRYSWSLYLDADGTHDRVARARHASEGWLTPA